MIGRFFALAAGDRALILRVVALVAAVRVRLWLGDWASVRSALRQTQLGPRLCGQCAARPPDRLAWAVRAASRVVPGATCLTQALALHVLLRATGRRAVIRIGIEAPGGRFASHAWVECDGRTLLDRPADLASFAEMVSWETL